MAFESTHAAMASEAALEAAHAHAAMIPTPRAISAGCGMSMRFDAEDDAAADTTDKTDTAKTDTAKTDTTKTDTSNKTDTTKKDN